MKKKLSPLEELRNKLREEDTEEIFKRKGLIRNPPTDEEIRLFIDNVAGAAFEQIKDEIDSYFVKVRVRKSKLGVSFYVTEATSNMYSCRIDLTPKRGLLSFTSYYAYPSELNYGRKSTLSLDGASIHFSRLNEITADRIISLFNDSFFRRIQKLEEYTKESKTWGKYDGNLNPYP